MSDGRGFGEGCPPGSNRGGGPKTADGKAAVAANLRVPAGEAALTHGVKARPGIIMACDRCAVKGTCESVVPGGYCPQELAYLQDRRQAVLSLAHLDAALDRPALEVLLWQEVRILRAARYLAEVGELLPGAESGYAEYQPLAKELPKLVASWRSTLQALGVTPAARRALEDKGEGGPGAVLAGLVAEVRKAEAAEKAATLEGDFEAQDGRA